MIFDLVLDNKSDAQFPSTAESSGVCAAYLVQSADHREPQMHHNPIRVGLRTVREDLSNSVSLSGAEGLV